MDHHPLRRIEGHRVGVLDAVEPLAKFRAKESRSGVSRIHVQPQLLLLANLANVTQVVESASARRSQSGANLIVLFEN